MECIVDTTVVNARKYYQTYMREPSPLGDIVIGAKELSATDSITLEMVLKKMKALGGKGELLVVTHSSVHGLLMDLMDAGGVSAGFEVLQKLLEIIGAIAARKAIAALPLAQRPKAWQKWFKANDPGIVLEDGFEQGNPGWEKRVEQWYREWHVRQAEVVLMLPKGSERKMDDFLKLVEDVRQAGFGRLEFRACDIGSDAAQLKAAAEFFRAKKIVAPRSAYTFFGSVARIEIMDEAKLAAKVKASPDALSFAGTRVAIVIQGDDKFQAWAPAKGEGLAFIRTYIHKDSRATEAPFVIGGLQPQGDAVIAGKPYVFPLESEYKSFLTTATL